MKDIFSLQSIGGMNEGLRSSSSQFMEIIHGIQYTMQTISTGFQDLLEGFGIIATFFGG